VVGLDLTRRRGGATFMSSGGYHHHVGANVWHSDGAQKRDDRRAGIAWFSIESANGAAYDALNTRLKTAHSPTNAIACGLESADPLGHAHPFR
jgi:catechol 2,3-dioxygenase